ncbi:MAG: archaeosortase/exosortase family protein, partial [Bryobacterales bacterium]|nr:archaeosortase/exosortase family protein [Bryobacterales bacterium]
MQPAMTAPAPAKPGIDLPARRVFEFGAIAVLIAVIYGRTLAGLFDDWWNQPSFSQGILLPPLALYFAWLDRRPLLAIRAQPSLRGLWLVAAGSLTFLAGKLAAEFFLQRFSLILVLAGLIWAYGGRDRLKRLMFPLILLATMIPLPAIFYNTATAP